MEKLKRILRRGPRMNLHKKYGYDSVISQEVTFPQHIFDSEGKDV